jgi:hypothetical protein
MEETGTDWQVALDKYLAAQEKYRAVLKEYGASYFDGKLPAHIAKLIESSSSEENLAREEFNALFYRKK